LSHTDNYYSSFDDFHHIILLPFPISPVHAFIPFYLSRLSFILTHSLVLCRALIPASSLTFTSSVIPAVSLIFTHSFIPSCFLTFTRSLISTHTLIPAVSHSRLLDHSAPSFIPILS